MTPKLLFGIIMSGIKIWRVCYMEEEETRNVIIDMVNQIDRLDVLEYIKIIVADIKAELED